MPELRHKMRRRDIPGTARFITFSCYRRLPLFNNDRIKDGFVQALTMAAARHQVAMLAWVVMPEHVHLIVFTETRGRVSTFLHSLKRTFSKDVLARWRALNAAILPRLQNTAGKHHFWQLGGGYDRNVVGHELIEKIIYIHKNPITRGLSLDSVSWKWSSAGAYRGYSDAIGPPIAFDLIPPHNQDFT